MSEPIPPSPAGGGMRLGALAAAMLAAGLSAFVALTVLKPG